MESSRPPQTAMPRGRQMLAPSPVAPIGTIKILPINSTILPNFLQIWFWQLVDSAGFDIIDEKNGLFPATTSDW